MTEKEPNIYDYGSEKDTVEKEERIRPREERGELNVGKKPEEKKRQEKEELEKARELLAGIEKEEPEKETEQGERRVEIIRELLEEGVPEEFKELIGDNSEEAWAKREELAKREPIYAAASLAGVASEKSRGWLDKNKERQNLWWGISRGLIGDDSKKSWEIRKYLEVDEKVGRDRGGRWSAFKKVLGLHKSERIFNLRGKIKSPGWYEPGDVVISTTGLDSEEAWRLREKFEKLAPAEALISLTGLDSEKAKAIRERHRGDKRLEWAYRKGLIGLDLEGQEKRTNFDNR